MTSSIACLTEFLPSKFLRSSGIKTRIGLMESRHESTTGTTSILLFSSSSGGRIPGGRSVWVFVPLVEFSDTDISTSMIQEACGDGASC